MRKYRRDKLGDILDFLSMYHLSLFTLILLTLVTASRAEVTLPNIFGDHMVLQREQSNPVWGSADPGQAIAVRIGGQTHETVADANGAWRIELEPLEVGGPYELVVEGENKIVFEDVLVGEVWICSGQSNMGWSMDRTNQGALYLLSATNPNIRLISVPNVGTQEAQDNFQGSWARTTPELATSFSAVGYYFGLRLYETLGIPVGLIDNAWGGSAAEAWIPREVLEAAGSYDEMLAKYDAQAAAYTDEIHAKKVAEYEEWDQNGRPGQWMRYPRDPRTNNQRPANIYNGVLHPTVGYGIRGAIWYQGESNAGRAYQYRSMFPLMIETWRDLWAQGDFPFYWVQLADFRNELNEPASSAWAELREAQTMALSLPNTGQAVIIDVGEGRDIHPRDKLTVGNRLARIALARDYGFDVAYQSPTYKNMEITEDGILLTFDSVGAGGLWAFDTKEVQGFSIAGEDQVFVWADAKIVGQNQVKVYSPEVAAPVAVRYGWADNPVINLYDRNGLPVTPFRTDEWPGVTSL